MKTEFLSFAATGIIGLATDTLSFLLYHNLVDMNVYAARCLAFLNAVVVTWLLNRTYTFKRTQNLPIYREFLSYLTAQSVGVTINFLTFTILIKYFLFFQKQPIVAVFLGSGVAMMVNFAAMKWVVFR